jgi:hypothetical protein
MYFATARETRAGFVTALIPLHCASFRAGEIEVEGYGAYLNQIEDI